jgi:TetR/AcrR family transcriptional regulator
MRERIRDAERSRQAILDAAEELFAERGYDGASLNDIGAAAGLSRGAPGYLFGSKPELYRAVLARVFAARQAATWDALAPVRGWCEAPGGSLVDALRAAVEAYMAFLLSRPSFARVITWEELAGAERLAGVQRTSDAMERTFAALREAVVRRGGEPFATADAVLLFVALTYAPLAHRHTLMRALGRDLADPAARGAHAELAAAQLVALVGRGL